MDDTTHSGNMIGERIKRRRKQLGLRQDQFPGVSRSALAMYESGQRTPPSDKLALIAQTLGLHLDDLTETITQRTGHKLYRLATEAYAAGSYREAFRYARHFWSWATDTRDPLEISKAASLVKSIAYHLTPEEMMHDEFDEMPYESLRGLINWTRLNDQWDFSLTLSQIMIKRWPSRTGEEYWKALRNRSRLCIDVGHFKQAVFWYEKALENPELPFDIEIQLRIGRQIALVYDGRGNPEEWSALRPHVTRNPLNWQMYWWVVTHHYWWSGQFKTLSQAYREALSDYPADWGEGYKLALAGVKAAIDWHIDRHTDSIDRLLHLLRTDTVDHVAGSDIMEDLWHDWLFLARDTNNQHAALEWSSYILHLVASKRTGLAQWLADRMPPVNADSMPVSMAILLSRFRSRSRPWHDPLIGDDPFDSAPSE